MLFIVFFIGEALAVMSSFIYQYDFAKRLVISQCNHVCRLHDNGLKDEAAIRATRIWNYIDCCDNERYLWSIMASVLDWMFVDTQNFNSFRFQYANVRVRFAGDSTTYEGCDTTAMQFAWCLARSLNRNYEDALVWSKDRLRWEAVAKVRSSRRCKLVDR